MTRAPRRALLKAAVALAAALAADASDAAVTQAAPAPLAGTAHSTVAQAAVAQATQADQAAAAAAQAAAATAAAAAQPPQQPAQVDAPEQKPDQAPKPAEPRSDEPKHEKRHTVEDFYSNLLRKAQHKPEQKPEEQHEPVAEPAPTSPKGQLFPAEYVEVTMVPHDRWVLKRGNWKPEECRKHCDDDFKCDTYVVYEPNNERCTQTCHVLSKPADWGPPGCDGKVWSYVKTTSLASAVLPYTTPRPASTVEYVRSGTGLVPSNGGRVDLYQGNLGPIDCEQWCSFNAECEGTLIYTDAGRCTRKCHAFRFKKGTKKWQRSGCPGTVHTYVKKDFVLNTEDAMPPASLPPPAEPQATEAESSEDQEEQAPPQFPPAQGPAAPPLATKASPLKEKRAPTTEALREGADDIQI